MSWNRTRLRAHLRRSSSSSSCNCGPSTQSFKVKFAAFNVRLKLPSESFDAGSHMPLGEDVKEPEFVCGNVVSLLWCTRSRLSL
ncbi:hypothetical protein HaLaN_13546, partial [Haematococcus lacustris]